MSSQISSLRGIILGYRRSKARQYNNQVIVKVLVDPKNVGSLVGAKIIANDRYGNVYRGKIVRVHSFRNCTVIAVFRPNIPGQLIGSIVSIIPKS